MKLVIFFVFTLLIGCGSMPGMPGYISAATSSYDGSVQYVMEPAFVYNGESALSGSDIRMGLLWNSAMGHDGDIVLVVEFLGLMSIDTGHSLAFKIDGKESLFSPIDDYTKYDLDSGVYGRAVVTGVDKSSKRYIVPLEFIRNIVGSKNVVVRVKTSRGSYSGIFSNDSQQSAINAFKEFLDKVDKLKAK